MSVFNFDICRAEVQQLIERLAKGWTTEGSEFESL
jgi:hypothetical protein